MCYKVAERASHQKINKLTARMLRLLKAVIKCKDGVFDQKSSLSMFVDKITLKYICVLDGFWFTHYIVF